MVGAHAAKPQEKQEYGMTSFNRWIQIGDSMMKIDGEYRIEIRDDGIYDGVIDYLFVIIVRTVLIIIQYQRRSLHQPAVTLSPACNPHSLTQLIE